MQIFSSLITLSLCLSALAAPAAHEHDHKTSSNSTMSHNSVKATCQEMKELTRLTHLANNQTLLEEYISKKKLNASEASELETKVASASTKLNALSSNATLVSECAVVDAHESLVVTCDRMARLEEWEKLSNATALNELAAKKNLTQTMIEHLKEKAANASTELKAMESNATLVAACQQLQAKKEKSNSTG
ncbi:hypothetical protein VTN77DRAFT_2935 [Rasamsonia byssochlamydoides]|uniref:uncharacterized protein n=1 Tax=Rasamsonia byssochlamydoides TaxID=89139 RepID=UPI003742E15C